ncbi:biotrophy-associated secreted protein 3 [Botryosphaeria dothidea]|uniref:Biotrophy-associated secreted protein 3 n=1 Tax=Botryosphaeria dothidea TaxID=55169 RepID=A0A8H4ILX4_9PEZI|nr:biotrophy-associated secreted protein 3 [Botryosphaeria dothidea]
MKFAFAVLSLLPAVALASIPSSSTQCSDDLRLSCPPSSDGVRRCLVDENTGASLCVTDCSETNCCTPGCLYQGWSNGFCTNGDYPCLCSNVDPGNVRK